MSEPAPVQRTKPRIYLVLSLDTAEPLGGHCPSCHGVMDETGCRVDKFRQVIDPDFPGFALAYEAACWGVPHCPCCELPEEIRAAKKRRRQPSVK